MDMYYNALYNNNFGLRRYYPWTGMVQQPPWVTSRVSYREMSYVSSILEEVFYYCDEMTVKRIENPYLWARYELRREEMMADSMSRNVAEEIVVHATSIPNAYEIAEDNFDWRLARRCRFGKGVSFAVDAEYAEEQATDNDAFIISGILVANCDFGHYGTRIPSYYSDTTCNRQESVFVKYNDNEYYPYYIVY